MKAVFIAPRKYVQGDGVLDETGFYAGMLGKRPVILWDDVVKGIVGETVLGSLGEADLEIHEMVFCGEATHEEAEKVGRLVHEKGIDFIIGIGGGKALDIAKAAAVETNLKLMTIPTIAATDAPISAASVWYDESGDFQGFECWPFNPDIVMVDTGVIARAPARTFAAGMGDALATWIEAEASNKTRGTTLAGGKATLTAMAIARLGFDTLLEYGIEALRAVELDVVTPAVDKVVEANVLHSGFGFESGGLATAHMVANPLSNYPECKDLMHGEKVAFGVITQLCLDEDIRTEDLLAIVDFMIAINLPVCFDDLNLSGATRETLGPIAQACAGEGSLCGNHPFPVTYDSIMAAMIAADSLGRERKALAGLG